MSTVRDLVKGSLRLLGAIATGETASAEEQADALSALNDMLDSWSTEGLIVDARVRETFTFTAGDGTYTLGTGGDFSTDRPLRIENASVIQSGSTLEMPIEIITVDQYAEIGLKSLQSSFPTRLYAEGTYPLETLNFWPVPSEAATLVLYSWKPLATYASANVDVELPQGFARALRYNLAVELAPEYGKAVSAEIAAIAQESKDNLKRMNTKVNVLSCDQAVLARPSSFNIYTGE